MDLFLVLRCCRSDVEIGNKLHREIANLKDYMIIVIRVLGKECEKNYEIET